MPLPALLGACRASWKSHSACSLHQGNSGQLHYKGAMQQELRLHGYMQTREQLADMFQQAGKCFNLVWKMKGKKKKKGRKE